MISVHKLCIMSLWKKILTRKRLFQVFSGAETPAAPPLKNQFRTISLRNHGIKPWGGSPDHKRVYDIAVFDEQSSSLIKELMRILVCHIHCVIQLPHERQAALIVVFDGK